ncbi:hypothetical protein AB0H88_03985 [Nonomuraea sp. NPDC050680]|uniref:hypothetical protein n=1 Tax=Nonomuraea sp. NPDC050680 TaxID=3154630 RepID=UPI0033D20BBC
MDRDRDGPRAHRRGDAAAGARLPDGRGQLGRCALLREGAWTGAGAFAIPHPLLLGDELPIWRGRNLTQVVEQEARAAEDAHALPVDEAALVAAHLAAGPDAAGTATLKRHGKRLAARHPAPGAYRWHRSLLTEWCEEVPDGADGALALADGAGLSPRSACCPGRWSRIGSAAS